MKKISLIIVSILTVILSCLCIAGCSNPDPVGVWKFKEMSAGGDGMKLKYEAGKTYMFGQLSFTEDTIVLEVNEDKTWTMTMALPQDEPINESGTWEVKSGKVYLYDENGEEEVVTISDNELTMTHNEDGLDYKIVLVLQTPAE